MCDPILYRLALMTLITIPFISYALSKRKLKYIFIPTIVSLSISFPMFFFVMWVPELGISVYLFYISMSLWTGGFFSLFINIYMYHKRKETIIN